ncbi:hypothetical protein ACJD0Z_09615 [Flavobacteriaceae bacterium M23B6Z8]
MKRLKRIIFLMWCACCLAGCAPHYYFFELLDNSVSGIENGLAVSQYSIVARHLPGDKVDLFQKVEIINLQESPKNLDQYSFGVNSTVFNYALSNINGSINGNADHKEEVIYSSSSKKKALLTIEPKDTLKLTVIHSLSKKISESLFRQQRTKERVTVVITIENMQFQYFFKTKNE